MEKQRYYGKEAYKEKDPYKKKEKTKGKYQPLTDDEEYWEPIEDNGNYD
jgi:hypothetical protein